MTDPLVRELGRRGYQAVFLPRTGVIPPEVYTYSRENQRLVRRGALSQYLPQAGTLKPKTGQLADISYEYKTEKKGSAAVSFLQNALKCIGVDAIPKLDLRFTTAKEFSFSFTKVTYATVDPSSLDPLWQSFSPTGIPAKDIEGGLHVAYEYAYASELLMSRKDKHDFETDISGKVGEFIDVGTKASVSVESKSTISFKSTAGRAAAFAYKAGKLVRENSLWVFSPEEISKGGLEEERKPFLPQPGIALFAQDEGAEEAEETEEVS